MTETIDGEATEIVPDGPSTELVVTETAHLTLFRTDEPAEIVQRATAVADQLAAVLRDRKLTANIQGREHVLVEGWTLLGTMLGVFPVVAWTRPLDDGWEARVEARTLAGAVVGAAEAECRRSEKSWKNRDDYALRSMAQTRAMSKALRGPLGFVVSLAGFDPTPGEEMSAGSGAGRTDGQQPASENVDPATVVPPDLATREQVGAALKHIDPTVDWRTIWRNACTAFYGTVELDEQQTFESWARLANVAVKLMEGGDFPPPVAAEIQAAFAEMFGGVVVEVEWLEPEEPAPIAGDTPEPDDTIEFGEEK